MRMQKEEKIVVVLLLMALGSLAVSWWAFDPVESTTAISVEGTESSAYLELEGQILNLKATKSGGHLLIHLDSTSIPIFVSRNSGAEELLSRLKIGDRVRVKGIQKEFQGQNEIEVSRSFDLQILD